MAWDASKPVTDSQGSSAEIRAAFAAVERSLDGVNLQPDAMFKIWAGGDAVAPTLYTLAGTGAACARIGTGLGDTGVDAGGTGPIGESGARFAAKITYGSAAATMGRTLLASVASGDYFRGRSFSMGALVRSSVVSASRLEIYDGVGSAYSPYHTGGGLWEWLTVTRPLDAAATQLLWRLRMEGAGSASISGPTPTFGEIPAKVFLPGRVARGKIGFRIGGDVAVGNAAAGSEKAFFRGNVPFIVTRVDLGARVAPTGANLIVDVNHYDGSVHQSMFTTKPTLVATNKTGFAVPDGTYRYRCFNGLLASGETDRWLTCDVDQVGSTLPGSDLAIELEVLQYGSPLEDFGRGA